MAEPGEAVSGGAVPSGGRLGAIDVLADPDRLAALDLDRNPGQEGAGRPG